jgi:hypothetical protein
MQEIVANNPLKLSDKLLEVSFKDVNIKIDLVSIFKNAKLSLGSKDLYVEVTDIFKSKYCRFESVRKWTNNEITRRYLNTMNNNFLNRTKLSGLKNIEKRHPKKNWYDKEWLDQPTPLIIVKRGRYNSGTWLHYSILLEFLSNVDIEMRIEINEKMTDIISEVQRLVINREDTKVLFHPLTDTIKDIYIPAQSSDNAKKFAYSQILDLANLKAIGLTSRTYKKKYSITNEQIKKDGKISIRDYMDNEELEKIKRVEEDINGLIKYAKITDYQRLKEELFNI